MATPQLLMGLRASDAVRSVFLSRPGVDVRYAADADLLISPFGANLMIITRGIVGVPYGTVRTVYFTEQANSPPLVFFSAIYGSYYTFPQLCYHSIGAWSGDRFEVTSYTDRITVYNRLTALQSQLGYPATDMYLRYFVVAKDAT
jgi:hypothetical protein